MIDYVKKRVTFSFRKSLSEAEEIQFMNLILQAIEPDQGETTLFEDCLSSTESTW